ncbi:MAG: pectate lyase [Acidobacteriia bacterium]|nr:pectate lyase [Terriglobia bacterium]
MRQPRPWYGSAEAVRIANQLLVYQHDNGGWEKNIDMAVPLGEKERGELVARKKENLGHTTIDNDATYPQMRYLARVYTATRQEPFRAAFQKGLDYVLEAQYPNGGWPQFYPLRDGYWSHITYNDDAMIGVMETLRSIVNREPDYVFVSDADRVRARQAIEKGIQCILT